MAIIKPFQGHCPPSEIAEKISSPPYDILTSNEARKIVKNNHHSFLRIIKPEVDFSSETELMGSSLHEHGAKNLYNLIAERKLIKDPVPCMYIYQIFMGNHSQTGVMVAASIEEYNSCHIKKHEFTRQDKEDDRTLHIDITNANTGPVFLTFRNDGKFKSILTEAITCKPDIAINGDNDTYHRLWKIDSMNFQKALSQYFETIPHLYIADGHHRLASAARVQKMRIKNTIDTQNNKPYNYFMAVIFPHDELQILSYNRVIKDLNGLSEAEYLQCLESSFIISPMPKVQWPRENGTYSMLLNNIWYKLAVKPGIKSHDPVESLDTSILQNNLLNPILEINDPRTDDRIDFIGGIRGLEELERRCSLDAKVAFALYPVSILDLMAVADAGKVLPPKSTWFEPKLKSGLVVRLLD